MRIGFDCWIFHVHRSGTTVSARNLLDALKRLNGGHEYIALRPPLRLPRGNLATKIGNLLLDLWYFHVWVPLKVEQARLDLIHYPANMASLTTACPRIVTIHDVSFLLYPEAYDPLWLPYVRLFVRSSAKFADQIVTVSRAAKQDIMRFYNVPEHRIEVIYNGVSPCFKPMDKQMAQAFVCEKYRLDPAPFVLFIGDLMPRKNLKRLIQAFAIFRETYGRQDYQLVIVGQAQNHYAQQLKQFIRHLQLTHAVHLVGYAPDKEVPLFLNAAELFAFVSLHEGFGLPPLEAMACGVPVVASAVSAIPEVLDDAALLVDPQDVEAIARAMGSAILDQELRQELIARGFNRASIFTWEKAAHATLAVYERVMGKS